MGDRAARRPRWISRDQRLEIGRGARHGGDAAPALAPSARAMARPMPRPAPVTRADAPCSSIASQYRPAPRRAILEAPAIRMEYKDYYKILGVPQRRPTRKSRPPTASWRASTTPTSTRATPRRRRASRRSTRPTRSCPIPRSAALRQRWAATGRRTGRPGGRARAPAAAPDRRLRRRGLGGFSDFFRTIFGGGGVGGGGRRGGPAAATAGSTRSSRQQQARPDRPGQDVEDAGRAHAGRGPARHHAHRADRRGRRRAARSRSRSRPACATARASARPARAAGRARRSARRPLPARHACPHPQFERKGDDLTATVTVPLTTAVLGGEVQVPTLDGPVGIKVPPGSRPGRVFRLRGHGLPRLEAGGGRGDLLAIAQRRPARAADARASGALRGAEEARALRTARRAPEPPRSAEALLYKHFEPDSENARLRAADRVLRVGALAIVSGFRYRREEARDERSGCGPGRGGRVCSAWRVLGGGAAPRPSGRRWRSRISITAPSATTGGATTTSARAWPTRSWTSWSTTARSASSSARSSTRSSPSRTSPPAIVPIRARPSCPSSARCSASSTSSRAPSPSSAASRRSTGGSIKGVGVGVGKAKTEVT